MLPWVSAIGADCTLGAVRVLVAPDKFKGTMTAAEAAEAIATGWRRADRGAEIDQVPLADGGEGTLDALVAALGGERRWTQVSGPLGDSVEAEYAVVQTPEGQLGVVEMARASGLQLLAERRRDPKRTTTFGTGELILAACWDEARRVLVCIGGSASNDGGAGMAQALGVRLLDASGSEIGRGGSALIHLASIDMRGLDPAVKGAELVVATDVDNPLVGPHGASAVYGPQKGASPEDVALLDRALRHFAAVVHRDLGLDIRDTPGAGAAGGLGGGLIAFLGAKLRPGVEVVMEAVRLRDRLGGADLVVTGEGAFDAQSLHGKAPAGVLREASGLGVRAIVLCGRAEVVAEGAQVFSLVERFGEEDAMTRGRELLTELASEVASRFEPDQAGGRATAPKGP
jgi:glycerate 2-kinase